MQAVHCGDDLRSAAAAVLGYTQTHNKGKEVRVDPVPGVATEQLRDALVFLLEEQKPLGKHHLEEHAGALRVLEDRLSGVMAARSLLSDAINNNGRGRLLGDRSRCRDVVFLDLALESASRSFVESEMDKLNKVSAHLHELGSSNWECQVRKAANASSMFRRMYESE